MVGKIPGWQGRNPASGRVIGSDGTACPVPDNECCECVWPPHCVGGCPRKRLFGGRQCVAFKGNPEAYVLALHARIGEDK